MKKEFVVSSVEETHEVASKIAKNLRGREVIELIGDVGAGKTTFVIGLAKALGCKEDVSSPTFKICNTYHGRLTVNHCDFYRLNDDKLITNEITEMTGPDSILVLEWSENLNDNLPDSIKIFIQQISDNQREITINTKL